MKKKKEEAYTFTPKGFFEAKIDDPTVLDKLLVFFMHLGYNALIWNENKREWEWGKVYQPKKGKKR